MASDDGDPWLTLSDLFDTPLSELTPKSQSSSALGAETSSNSRQLEPAPDWLETQVIAMGYVKHPLEQLLEWLDRAMLWLEALLERVIRWLQKLYTSK